MLAVVLVLASLSGSASAQVTHKFIDSFATGGISPQGVAMDAEGYLYAYAGSVRKYDQDGNPVDFSALETNVIDGIGNGDCPSTPADCDQVPQNGLFGTYGGMQAMAVDGRASGPGAGYIYVFSFNTNPQPGKVEVFDPTGKFVGQIDNTIAFPERAVGHGVPTTVSVDQRGHVYLAYNGLIDQYKPTDPDPAKYQFVGQLRGEAIGALLVGGYPFSYGYEGPSIGQWRKFDAAAWFKQKGDSDWLDLSPAPGPFGSAGSSGNYMSASIDPVNQDVYLGSQFAPVVQWDKDDNQIGVPFGPPHIGDPYSIAIDAETGHLFMPGSANGGMSIAEFSDEVIIPDVSYGPPDLDHTSFIVDGEVGLAGGPQVDECRIEWGTDAGYGSSVPCDQPTPFASDTGVGATIGGLTTETDYHYRIVAVNANGTSPGEDRVARPPAV
ncbi:MAG: hypothetical protein ACRDHY_03755, partial [Anaerolineales bacterium]